NTQQLDLDNFVEVIFTTTLQNRAGVWLNPALGSALFTAFDATGASLESVTGSAGNFVAVTRATNDIKFVSIVGGLSGFTIDDLTYGLVDSAPREVPEPGLALLLGLGVTGLVVRARRRPRTPSRPRARRPSIPPTGGSELPCSAACRARCSGRDRASVATSLPFDGVIPGDCGASF